MHLFFLRYFFICCILYGNYFNQACIAQSIITTAINTNTIKIGEPFTLTLHGYINNAILKKASLAFPDTLLHFDIMDSGTIKLQYSNNQITGFTQNILLTSFDSGTWAIPQFNISLIETINNNTIQLFSDSIPIQVQYLKTDSSFTLNDVKPIIEIEGIKQNKLWMYIIILSLFVLLILVWFVKNKKIKKTFPPDASSIYQKSIQQLNALSLLDINNATQLLQYHTTLKQIFKTYLIATTTFTQQDKTTTGILLAVKQQPLTNDLFTAIANSLRMADAVQFAKYTPDVSSSKQSLNNILAAINHLHHQHK